MLTMKTLTRLAAVASVAAVAAAFGWTQLATSPAVAEDAVAQPADPAPAAEPAPTAPAATVPIPDNAKLTLMIQLHVAALSLSNLTGDYSVLFALGSPAFRAANPVEKLSQNFASFRSQGIDISPALLFAPILLGPPKMGPDNVLHVAGFYATKPQRIAFELAFQPANNAWRLADIQVRTVVPDPAAGTLAPAAAAKAPAAAAAKPKTKKSTP